MKRSGMLIASSIALLAAGCVGSAYGPQQGMSFFVTSTGSGKGADFGGLAGADKHCLSLATAAGAVGHAWHAYLSNSATASTPAVNARDRIGSGPWQNAKGVVIARNVDELHGDNNLNKQTALTEKGEVVNSNEDTPNKHDILTGSQPDGTAFTGSDDKTCGNWTKSGEGSAIVGHHNRNGTGTPPATTSWNSAHATRGCSDEALKSAGGAGLLYCFATK